MYVSRFLCKIFDLDKMILILEPVNVWINYKETINDCCSESSIGRVINSYNSCRAGLDWGRNDANKRLLIESWWRLDKFSI